MMENQACCAHLQVEYRPITIDDHIHEAWQCVLCGWRFYPVFPRMNPRLTNGHSEGHQDIVEQTCEKPGSMMLTGSTAFALERDALKADNDRLRRELEEARAELARMRPVVEAAKAWRKNTVPLRTESDALVDAVDAYLDGAGKGDE